MAVFETSQPKPAEWLWARTAGDAVDLLLLQSWQSRQTEAMINCRARASELGAVFNGTTQEERVNYYLTVPADSLDASLLARVAEAHLELGDHEAARRAGIVIPEGPSRSGPDPREPLFEAVAVARGLAASAVLAGHWAGLIAGRRPPSREGSDRASPP